MIAATSIVLTHIMPRALQRLIRPQRLAGQHFLVVLHDQLHHHFQADIIFRRDEVHAVRTAPAAPHIVAGGFPHHLPQTDRLDPADRRSGPYALRLTIGSSSTSS